MVSKQEAVWIQRYFEANGKGYAARKGQEGTKSVPQSDV